MRALFRFRLAPASNSKAGPRAYDLISGLPSVEVCMQEGEFRLLEQELLRIGLVPTRVEKDGRPWRQYW